MPEAVQGSRVPQRQEKRLEDFVGSGLGPQSGLRLLEQPQRIWVRAAHCPASFPLLAFPLSIEHPPKRFLLVSFFFFVPFLLVLLAPKQGPLLLRIGRTCERGLGDHWSFDLTLTLCSLCGGQGVFRFLGWHPLLPLPGVAYVPPFRVGLRGAGLCFHEISLPAELCAKGQLES